MKPILGIIITLTILKAISMATPKQPSYELDASEIEYNQGYEADECETGDIQC